jgi:hypothetical protein
LASAALIPVEPVHASVFTPSSKSNFLNLNLGYAGMSNQQSPLDDYVDSDPEAEIPKELADKLLEDDNAMETDQHPETQESAAGGDGGVRTAPTCCVGTQTDLIPEPGPRAARSSVSSACSRALSTTSTATLRYNNNSHLPKAYFNIKAARESERTVRHLDGGAVHKYDSIGSFASIDCDYSPLPNYRHNYAAKQNISSTFTLDEFACSVCTGTAKGHVVLHRGGPGSRPGTSHR